MADQKDDDAVSEHSRFVRRKIERELNQKREQRRREMLRKRIELAKQGLSQFESKRYAEAAQTFLTYIRILEEWKKVPLGGLNPSLFDPKLDLAEMLLISSVYWHLVKLFDRSDAGTAEESDFRTYMSQFLLFTRGFSYQPLAAETMRKYIRSQKPNHIAEFNASYKQIGSTKCFVATAVFDLVDDDTIDLLRRYRDQSLSRSNAGRLFVRVYYRVGPVLAWGVSRMPLGARRVIASVLDRVASWIS